MLINGEPRETLSASDRGLRYGDGLFETLAVSAGRPCLWRRHLERLTRGCVRLAIPCPDPDLLRREAARVLKDRQTGVLRILVTRGPGEGGYGPPEQPAVTRILEAGDQPRRGPAWTGEGLAVRLCRTPLGNNPALAGIKHLNRLEQVLARAEWTDQDYAEGLMLDVQGRVVAGTSSNLVVRRGDRLLTPRLHRCGVAGVVRGLLLELAREAGTPVEEVDLEPADLGSADALYLSNSLIGMRPVVRLEHRHYDPAAWPHPLVAATMARVYGP